MPLPSPVPSPRPGIHSCQQAGLVHRHAQQRDGSIAHTGTSGTTPHGKNESIARAGIKSKPNTRHHQIRLWLHVRPAQRTGCATRRHGPRRVRSRGLFGRKVGGGDVAWSVRDGVTLLGPLRTVYRSRRYGVTLLGPLMAVERTEGLRQGLRRDTQVVVFAQLQDASG